MPIKQIQLYKYTFRSVWNKGSGDDEKAQESEREMENRYEQSNFAYFIININLGCCFLVLFHFVVIFVVVVVAAAVLAAVDVRL